MLAGGHHLIVDLGLDLYTLSQRLFVLICDGGHFFVISCESEHEHTSRTPRAIREHHYLLASQINLLVTRQSYQPIIQTTSVNIAELFCEAQCSLSLILPILLKVRV